MVGGLDGGLYVTITCRGLSYLFLSYLVAGYLLFLQHIFSSGQGNEVRVFLLSESDNGVQSTQVRRPSHFQANYLNDTAFHIAPSIRRCSLLAPP